jgi:hypothetical protein
VDKADVLVPNDLDLINESEPTEIISQLLLRQAVVQTSHINIPARITLADSEPHLCGDRRRFSPANFEFLAVQRQFLDCRISVEGSCRATIQEGQKNTRLLGKHADGL